MGRRAPGRSSSSPRESSFGFGVDVGGDVDVDELRARHDAVVLATGSRVPRDLPVPGRELAGVHFAMEYLYDRARRSRGEQRTITAAGKHVVVIGGGDTGADCVGHAHREGAASVTQIELLGEPPVPPRRRHAVAALADEAAHVVCAQRGWRARFAISTTEFAGADGRVERIHWRRTPACRRSTWSPGTEESHPAELVLLAMGFVGPEPALLDAPASSATAVATRRPRATRPRRGSLRRGRCAARPVADRLGDQRGARMRKRGGRMARCP